jgi:CO/xanthine dehydrogenase Mo-binding subunit
MKRESTAIEPERYEFTEAPRYRFTLTRRAFVQIAGAGLLITTTGGVTLAQRGSRGGEPGVNHRFQINKDGTVTLFTSKVEVGQGSRTQLAMAAAEELHVPLDQIQVVMADTDQVPDDGGTFGSHTTPRTVPSVREAAAEARALLIELAAQQWNGEAGTVTIKDGALLHSDGRSKTLAELVAGATDMREALGREPDSDAEMKDTSEWQVLGKATTKKGGEDVVRGTHRYASDIRREGMIYGKVMRPPAYNARLTSVDLSAVKNMEGVVAVRDEDFVACAAPTSRQAQKAVEALAETAAWEASPHPSSDELFAHLKSNVQEGSGRRRSRDREAGDVEAAMNEASSTLRGEYHWPYVQHAPMEPRAAVAEWDGDKLTVWTGTQRPFGVRGELARAFRMNEENVRVIVPDTGGGFGGKHTGDAAIEAARLAKEARKPVSLQWTRDEEFTWAYFRPAGVLEMAAGWDKDGKLIAWEHINYNSGSSGIECPYNFANKRVSFKYCDSPLREGSYRALASPANTFAREAFIDRLAKELNEEPLAMRNAYLDDGRLKNVLNAAAEAFGWANRSKPDDNTGFGIACGTEKGSYVATCVELAVDSEAKSLDIRRILVAFECGAIQNPPNLRAQVEGSIVMGLGPALREAMVFRDGKIQNGRFKEYGVPRFKDVPPLETVLVDRPDLASEGAGETPIIALAPAMANAILDATGKAPEAIPLPATLG